jgi:hypothetical protein
MDERMSLGAISWLIPEKIAWMSIAVVHGSPRSSHHDSSSGEEARSSKYPSLPDRFELSTYQTLLV